MSISPPGDLVLDVARAADPKLVAAATQRLQALSASAGGDGFSLALDATQTGMQQRAAATASLVHAPEVSGVRAASNAPKSDPYGALGGFLLQKAVEQMMPAPSSATFGAGTAGSVWRSSLAEHLAAALAPSVFKLSTQSERLRVEPTPAVAASPAPLA